MAEHPTPIVVVADSVEDNSLRISMNALRAGALSVVEKPVATTHAGYEGVAGEICTQLRIMAQVPVIRRRPIGTEWAGRSAVAPQAPLADLSGQAPSLLGIAASTGGPPALARVIGALPKDFPLPVLVVQHMGAAFMDGFASWLDSVVALPVSLAQDGERAEPGRVYVARATATWRSAPAGSAGDRFRAGLGPAPGRHRAVPVHGPAIRPSGIGVLLTGMGEDGAVGPRRHAQGRRPDRGRAREHRRGLRHAGGGRASGAARAVLPLDRVADHVLRLVDAGGAAVRGGRHVRGCGRILLVEDSETQALEMRLLLEAHGFAVERCASAETAPITSIAASPTSWWADYHLPGMNGDELIRQMRLYAAHPGPAGPDADRRQRRRAPGLESGADATCRNPPTAT